jgi:6-phosphogluconolactonase
MTVEISADADTLAQTIAARMTELLERIQADGTRPSVVLTGGTIAIDTYEALSAGSVDWSEVDFYWGDERFVPAGHADRNDQQARDAFLTRLGVPNERIHSMPSHGCDLSTADAADEYAAGLPRDPFDLVLLGVGPDGHVASLFPGFAQLHETARQVVEVFDSPKPPPVRISMTFPRLNNSARVWFLVAGEGKAEAVARALGNGTLEDTPATGAHGIDESLWLIDEAAASQLT